MARGRRSDEAGRTSASARLTKQEASVNRGAGEEQAAGAVAGEGMRWNDSTGLGPLDIIDASR
ncbi:hypothetical protein OsJ_11352 [Oryza sativa Japonica Group]|uniref:Uncharacterized protein n=2 Tax=Oryza sativa subsp. japonica TaxID=39947 RepID=A3AJB6_ORYSJ|nr:hypothetical protein [Oryza sativa Japonica Group]ABF96735.1 hypothetical protein LOC_Os03g31410 [Oryza sativa Japonica Group]EAZ27405.1 hypothetical protein OsJ_11352 [Oryza sativa Japonica Group]